MSRPDVYSVSVVAAVDTQSPAAFLFLIMSYLVTASALPLRLGGGRPAGGSEAPGQLPGAQRLEGHRRPVLIPGAASRGEGSCIGCGSVSVDCQERERPCWAARSRGESSGSGRGDGGQERGLELCPRAVQSDVLSPGSPHGVTSVPLEEHTAGPASCCWAHPLSVALKLNLESAPKV